jgi:hypothetical protein
LKQLQRRGALLCLCLGFLPVWAAPIATLEITDGTVTLTRTSGKRSIVAVGSTLEEGETINTEKDSYARLKFTDGSEVAVRPSSSLVIRRYHFEPEAPGKDALLMQVAKGGMRTVTGLIGKRGNQGAYRVQGGTATIGIRGTEYIARVCSDDCSADNAAPAGRTGLGTSTPARKRQSNPPLTIVARLVEMAGRVTIRSGEKSRTGALNEALYNGETVLVSNPGGAALVFNDQTRVVLNPGTEYQLTSIRYNPKQPDQGNVLTGLAKGGLRMMTGLLGKRLPQNVKIETVTATIGIRGTNFDLWCASSGENDPTNAERSFEKPEHCDQALYASTREGAIEMQSGQHKLLVPAGKVGYVDSPGAVPGLLDAVPGFLKDSPLPQPEDIPADMPQLFGQDGSGYREPGLYVSVKEGKVELTQASGESMLLQKGEAGYAGVRGESLVRLGSDPEFVREDAYLREMNVDPATCRAN